MTSRQDAHDWLARYGAAWVAHDGAAAAQLFTPDAHYHWGPYEPVLAGRAAIEARWNEATAEQGDVGFRSEILAVEGDRVVARWWAELSGPGLAIDGVFVLDFDASLLCSCLQEWWLIAPGDA